MLAELRSALCGRVLAPGDAGYDEARRIHNGMFERRAAAIARCLGAADIIDAIRFAQTHGLELAVRGGGHSVAGKSVCEGGLMLDLSLMKGIHVDPTSSRSTPRSRTRRMARVRRFPRWSAVTVARSRRARSRCCRSSASAPP
ncbi:MAG TPA: FAD-binding protein [Myxococcota bacterium]|nr:FAD-binding protein [Myxococcota bacterium]